MNRCAGVARVGDTRDRCVRSVALHLDTKAVIRVGHLIVQDVDGADGDVAGDRADGNTMTSGALVVLEGDIRALVDSQAIILIHYHAVLDDQVAGRDIEAIGVVAGCVTVGGAVGIVSGGCTKRSVPFRVTD